MTDQENTRINIAEPIAEICRRFGLDPGYVARIDCTPGDLTITLYQGKDGRCQGAKFMNEDGEAATETLKYRVLRMTDSAAELLKIWLESDQPCRAWCMAEGSGRLKCYGEDGELIAGCWFEEEAKRALAEEHK